MRVRYPFLAALGGEPRHVHEHVLHVFHSSQRLQVMDGGRRPIPHEGDLMLGHALDATCGNLAEFDERVPGGSPYCGHLQSRLIFA